MAFNHEKTIIEILLEATQRGWRLFKNAQGLGYSGKVSGTYSSGVNKYTTLKNARVIKYGVCNPGGLDLIGWQTVEITAEMVGQKLAVFTAVDAKTKGYAYLSKDQKNFIEAVKAAGGKCYVGIMENEKLKIDEK